jgi:hypothetical protein
LGRSRSGTMGFRSERLDACDPRTATCRPVTLRLRSPSCPVPAVAALEQRMCARSPHAGRRGLSGAHPGAVPAGSEFQINTYTSGNQTSVDGSMDAHGNLIFTWVGRRRAPSTCGRGDAAGDGLGDQFRVNPVTETVHPTPSVAATARGISSSPGRPAPATGWPRDSAATAAPLASRFRHFDLESADSGRAPARRLRHRLGAGPVSDTNILAQRFDRSGVRVGAEFQVNTYTTGQQTGPAVALTRRAASWSSGEARGRTVVTRVFGQRFGAAGARLRRSSA